MPDSPSRVAESPWGSAQFQFVHDTARTGEADLPRSYAELADWIVANPGRFTYPAPPAFHGTRFLKQWLYELSGGPDATALATRGRWWVEGPVMRRLKLAIDARWLARYR
jgi:putative spermidine/putrescine transport system substrate-binding protein